MEKIAEESNARAMKGANSERLYTALRLAELKEVEQYKKDNKKSILTGVAAGIAPPVIGALIGSRIGSKEYRGARAIAGGIAGGVLSPFTGTGAYVLDAWRRANKRTFNHPALVREMLEEKNASEDRIDMYKDQIMEKVATSAWRSRVHHMFNAGDIHGAADMLGRIKASPYKSLVADSFRKGATNDAYLLLKQNGKDGLMKGIANLQESLKMRQRAGEALITSSPKTGFVHYELESARRSLNNNKQRLADKTQRYGATPSPKNQEYLNDLRQRIRRDETDLHRAKTNARVYLNGAKGNK